MERTRLCVSRRKGESVLIGNDIKITVTRTKGGECRFAIIAPESIKILREELALDIKFRPMLKTKVRSQPRIG